MRWGSLYNPTLQGLGALAKRPWRDLARIENERRNILNRDNLNCTRLHCPNPKSALSYFKKFDFSFYDNSDYLHLTRVSYGLRFVMGE